MTEPQLVPKTTADAVVEAIIAATMPAAVKEDFSEYARSGIASMYLGEQTVLVLGRTVDWEVVHPCCVCAVCRALPVSR